MIKLLSKQKSTYDRWDRCYHDRIIYDPSKGAVNKYQTKNNWINKYFNRCRKDYDETTRGDDPSIFFGYCLCSLVLVSVLYAAVLCESMFAITGTAIVYTLATICMCVGRPGFTPFFILSTGGIIALTIIMPPKIRHDHVINCECALHYLRYNHNLSKEERECFYDNYVQENKEQLKKELNIK